MFEGNFPRPRDQSGSEPTDLRPDKEAMSEPGWRSRALENVSPEDRATLDRMRAAFQQRGLTGDWYYEGANLDLTPVFMAPDGVQHHFVDPVYSVDKGREYVNTAIAKSWLGQEGGVQHTDDATGLQTVLEGGSRIEWEGREGGTGTEAAVKYDVVFTNNISPVPSAQALDALRTGGILVVDAPSSVARAEIDHPTAVRPLTDMGFRVVQENIPIKRLRPENSDSLSVYHTSGRHNFTILEKTTPLSDEDYADLNLNEVHLQVYQALRAAIYREGFGRSDTEFIQTVEGMVRDAIRTCYRQLGFVPTELQHTKKAELKAQLQERITSKTVNEVFLWLLDVDSATGEHDIVDKVNPSDLPQFKEQLGKVTGIVERVFDQELQ